MTRDEIYNHLAQVYLGKRNKSEEKKKKQFNAAWLGINLVITVIILASSFYGLTAFLTHRAQSLQNHVIFALNNGPIRIKYDFTQPYPSVKAFSLTIPKIDLTKYEKLNFTMRGLEEGHPGVVKVVIRNAKKESAFYFIHNVGREWKDFSIPLSEFKTVTDWSNLIDISFVFEAWNIEKKKGAVLIDEVSFSS